MAAPSIVASTKAIANPTVTSLTIAYPTASSGDILLLWVANGSFTTSQIATPSGWTDIFKLYSAADYNIPHHACFWKAYASESGNMSVTTLSGGASAIMASVSGAHQTTPIDVYGTTDDNNNDTTCTSPSVTAVTTEGLLFTSYTGIPTIDVGPSFSQPTGLTELQDSPCTTVGNYGPGMSVNYLALSGSGATGTYASTASITSYGLASSIVIAPGTPPPVNPGTSGFGNYKKQFKTGLSSSEMH